MAGIKNIVSALCGVIALSATGAVAQDVGAPERRTVIVENMDFFGGDLESRFDVTFETCERICLDNDACTAFTYNIKASSCFPKAGFEEMRAYDGAVSARIVKMPDVVLSRIKTREADLDFLPGGYLKEAHTLARQVGVEFPANERTAKELIAKARDATPRWATSLYAASLNVEDAPDVWSDLSRVFLRTNSDDWRESRELLKRGAASAVNSYLRAETPSQQANALNQIAVALEKRGDGRQMIDALRLSNKLARRDSTEEALERAIKEYGFRITDHSVDSNAANPRICMNFSEDLLGGDVEFGPYVKINERDLPIEAEDRQLCIDGVEHGSRYKFTVREGLPAASGEKLNRSVDLDVYVRDRNPAVRFTGRSYVLPKSARAAIPVVTVNLDEVKLRIHRVGVRNLRTVAQRNMLDQALDGYSEREIDSDYGSPVWEGIGEVDSRLNDDVTTALPIGDAITSFEPGVYVMTARTENQEDYTDAATQWFVVTDLGLTTLEGSDGLHVFARSLASADPVAGAEVSLIANNNEVLGTAKTDAEGYLKFAPGLTRGDGGSAPAMLTIEGEGGDFAFLDLTQAGFDLSDRGVEGRRSPGPIDIFATTERGAYRPGETVHLTVLARDARADAVADLPLTAIVTRPDGVEHSRTVLKDAGAGGRTHAIDIPRGARRGSWSVGIHTDAEKSALVSEDFLVEDFTPERIDFQLDIPAETIRITDVPTLNLDAQYLYGAPAGDLPISGSVRVSAAKGFKDYPGYRFGVVDERVSSQVENLPDELMTDADGKATLALSLPAMGDVSKPLTMTAIIRVRDSSGRPVERSLQRPILPVTPLVGIKPLFEDTVEQGGLARFEVIGIDTDANRSAFENVAWEISRLDTRYQWYETGGSWRYEPITRRERIASGSMAIGADSPAVVEAPVKWGRYELKVATLSGDYTASSIEFDAGWYAPVAGSDTPDMLEVSLDSEKYSVGDTAKLRVNARFAGKVLVAVLDNRLIDMKAVAVEKGETIIDLPVTAGWGPGAYLSATLIRPMDAEAGRNPSRAIGIQWAAVDPGERKLDVSITTPDAVDPRGPMKAAIKIGNLAPGKTAYATIAAVDVGVLNLTGFKAPEPGTHYFGQRRLGMNIRDVYGRLIDGSIGTLGRIRSGGGGAASGAESPPANEDVVAFFSGVLTADENGVVSTTFDIPDFNGTVKVMVVVWSDEGIGSAEKDVKIVDPIVVTVSVPRFLALGDSSRVLVDLAHSSGPAGEVKVDIVSDDGLTLGTARSALTLAEKGRGTLIVPVSASIIGDPEIRIITTTPDKRVLTKTVRLAVRANDPEVLRQNRIPLAANGGTLTVDASTFSGFREGTGRATLAVGPLARFDVPGLLRDLDVYPYGCTEQTTSKAFPLLSFNDVADAMGMTASATIEERVESAIKKVLTNQANGGSFGLWRPSSGDAWLDAYVTDFLSQARAKGYQVPDAAMKAALSNLKNRLAYAGDFDKGGEDLAYALMVLAREGSASIGDLRYFADAKAEALSTPLAKAQLGAALASYGEQQRADYMFGLASRQIETRKKRTPYWRIDYGSTLRDAAGVLALAVEAGSDAVNRDALTKIVTPTGLSQRQLSTQEKVWTLFAAKALIGDASSGDITVDGVAYNGPLVRLFEDDTMGDNAVVIANQGDKSAEAILSSFGIPTEPPKAGGNGFTIERTYYTLEGEETTPDAVEQNGRLVTVLWITGRDAPQGRLMINDPLPAGFEIDNPTLLRAGEIDGLGWLDVRSTVMSEFRSDRFLAAVNSNKGESFQLAYIVRAVSPGQFYHPAASVEDMYRPEFRANTDAGRVEVLGPTK